LFIVLRWRRSVETYQFSKDELKERFLLSRGVDLYPPSKDIKELLDGAYRVATVAAGEGYTQFCFLVFPAHSNNQRLSLYLFHREDIVV